ncbi:hypothetical protein [Kocuria arenosa]
MSPDVSLPPRPETPVPAVAAMTGLWAVVRTVTLPLLLRFLGL